MRSLLVALAASTTLAPLAHADIDTTATVPAAPTDASTVKLAVAINPPVRWFTDEKAVAASLYVGAGEHHVIRGNVARYPYGALLDFGEAENAGDVTDLGASYMYFPRRAFDGFVVEAGAVYRQTEGVSRGPFFDDTTEKTSFIAGRGLVGWSWMLGSYVFTSVQVGASVGYERGMKSLCSSSCMNEGADPMVTRVKELTFAPEGFMRIGVVFDM